jgi:glyoxylase-like metal-dependent hydrolase (beta-lactamase superfamily II)
MSQPRILQTMTVLAAWLLSLPIGNAQPSRTPDAVSPDLKLYVLDGGVLASDPARYNLREDEVESTSLSVAAYLIVHPNGVLLWDAGAIADSERIEAGTGAVQTIIRADLDERHVTLAPPMLEQLAQSGYAPGDVTHISLSHYHWDHTANANSFAHAKWLVRPGDLNAMFSANAGGSARNLTYGALQNSEKILVTSDEFDVFGDGSVILKGAPGHTPGHQVLYVNLQQTGPIVLAGDLYHFGEERSLNRLPVAEFDLQATRASRAAVEEFLARKNAELWIQHDLSTHRKLRKAPAFYE